ncbi:hypothetical protein RZE82_07545 [Mollicutes bacterium LVI A0039]|nr:hypothetical protein RZE82_07545 [Mollicutes bacterium LVI A0039]
MKKILGSLIILVALLTGCEDQESDYITFKEELTSLNDAEAVDFALSTNYLPDFEVVYTVDTTQELYKMTVGPTTTFVTNEHIYFTSGGGWIKSNVNEQLLVEFKQFGIFANIISDLPEGDFKIPDDCTGIEELDKVISGKSLADLLVSTGVNTYTIKGLENNISFNTSHGLIINVDTVESGKLVITITNNESIVIPEAALSSPTTDEFSYQLTE